MISERKVHLKEFLLSKSLRPEQQAGFIEYIEDVRYKSRDGWEQIFNEYKNRKLR